MCECNISDICADFNEIGTDIADMSEAIFDGFKKVVDEAERLVKVEFPKLIGDVGTVINAIDNIPAEVEKLTLEAFNDLVRALEDAPRLILVAIILFIIIFLIIPPVLVIFFIR